MLYIPYRLYLRLKRPIDTIVFSNNGIVIENKKIDLYKSIPWKKINEITIIKKDADKKPEEILISTLEEVTIINLKLYHTFFTSTEDIGEKISTICEHFNSIKNQNNSSFD
ncbi:MAG TPA: hypothetical protein VMZ29_13570 [Candidatus Bathyarchaeia archaeon]|nr:hypothetical protein [Candidatus Bathyarchaeia archaeon]